MWTFCESTSISRFASLEASLQKNWKERNCIQLCAFDGQHLLSFLECILIINYNFREASAKNSPKIHPFLGTEAPYFEWKILSKQTWMVDCQGKTKASYKITFLSRLCRYQHLPPMQKSSQIFIHRSRYALCSLHLIDLQINTIWNWPKLFETNIKFLVLDSELHTAPDWPKYSFWALPVFNEHWVAWVKQLARGLLLLTGIASRTCYFRTL